VVLAFEGLTRIDDELNTVPAAAESWTLNPDGLTLTFHLRDGLVYSDGSPLTAERFRYAIERTSDPRTGSAYAPDRRVCWR
jgi:oligopeptide transport system substrate-binding protein